VTAEQVKKDDAAAAQVSPVAAGSSSEASTSGSVALNEVSLHFCPLQYWLL
jgi:hypothetical protein